MISYPPLSWSADDLPELLRPAIEKYRDEADELRRLPGELVGQLRAHGAFRLNTPRELGGFELPLASALNVIEQLARLDGPVSWVVWNLNVGFGAAFLDEPSVERIWADGPDPLIAHSSQPGFLVPSGDGYQLSGEWKLVSGIDSCEWVGLLGVVLDGERPRMTEAGPDVRFCVVPRSSVTVRDTWQVTGMRGTDSNTVTAQDVHVPAEMTLRPTATPRIDRPLFRVPLMNQINSGGAAIVIGMAQAAIDEVLALSRTKTTPDGTSLEQQPRVQAAVGAATARLDAARALLLATVGALDTAVEAGRSVTEAHRGAVRGALCHAAETARSVLTSMYEIGSSTVLYEENRVGRLFRDGHAAAQHAILSAAGYEVVGRTVLGLPAGDPFL
ncbi:acyl-CoA dehydrogenase family protein [Amycolatopsis sp. NPDC049252]|uniref:acyl-CoA dehydrogenase family protein n=1 Tax=Amycolatopsis sp. NPDC049252 TaxID=3363933 RepID=UPI003710264C